MSLEKFNNSLQSISKKLLRNNRFFQSMKMTILNKNISLDLCHQKCLISRLKEMLDIGMYDKQAKAPNYIRQYERKKFKHFKI